MSGKGKGDRALCKSIESILMKIQEIEASVQNFNSEHQELLNARLLQLANDIKGLNEYADDVSSIRIPVEILRFVDEGGSPEQYAQEILKACRRDNQISKGKVVAIKSFQENLLNELENAFPSDTKEYRSLLEASEEL